MRIKVLTFTLLNLFLVYGQEFTEDLNWYFYYGEKSDSIYVGESGSVQYSLWKAGFLPDPFIDSNDLLYSSLENEIHTFRSQFIGDPYLNFEHVDLILNSVDTYAEVFVNGDPVLLTENAFLNYRVDIAESLVSGINEIELRLIPVVLFHEEEYENEKYHLPAPNDNHAVSIASRVRKPQFQFGWDWVPRLNTLGINGVGSLNAYNDVCFEMPNVYTYMVNDTIGVIRYSVKVRGDIKKISAVTGFSEREVEIEKGVAIWNDTLVNPELWYPIGKGEQNLYGDQITLYTNDNQYVNKFNIKYGFRISELVQHRDNWGESYYFEVNNKRVFAKGANLIPSNIFIHEITSSGEVKLAEELARSNFNMVRVWGGGTYASDAFLDACDSLGIMVWHDLMFACAMYPGNENFLNNVSDELDQQLSRVLSHPCVVQINGNNEVDVAWKNWGLQKAYNLNLEAQGEISKAYHILFKDLAGKHMQNFPGIPYTHTSPLSNWGKRSDFDNGTQHYWGLWHGNDDLSDANIKIGRFNSEYGFQSFPSLSLLQDYSSSELQKLSDPLLAYRQRSYVGNNKILEKIEPLYGKVIGLEDFIYKSQLYQAKALETYIKAHRKNALRCGGSLYWQFNDVYPGPTWSSVDFAGNYKAAYYAGRNNFEEVLVSWDADSLFVSNLSVNGIELQIDYVWLDLSGKVKEEGRTTIATDIFETQIISLQPKKKKNKKKDLVLKLSYSDGPPMKYDKVFTRKVRTGLSHGVVEIQEVSMTSTGQGVLVLKVDEFNEKTWVQCDDPTVKLEENFLDLLPGIHRVSFKCEEMVDKNDFHIYGN